MALSQELLFWTATCQLVPIFKDVFLRQLPNYRAKQLALARDEPSAWHHWHDQYDFRETGYHHGKVIRERIARFCFVTLLMEIPLKPCHFYCGLVFL